MANPWEEDYSVKSEESAAGQMPWEKDYSSGGGTAGYDGSPTIANAVAQGKAGMHSEALAQPMPPAETPRHLQDTSFMQDVGTAVGSGLKGSLIGASQLAAEGIHAAVGSEFTQGRVDIMRQKEAERRSAISPLKSKYGEPGLSNPLSWAETGGETAPYLAAGLLTAGRAAASQLPISWFRTAGTGMLEGAAGGAGMPLVEDESRLASTAIGAATGGVFTPAARLGMQTATKLTGAAKGQVTSSIDRLALRKADPEAYAAIKDPSGKIIENGLRRVAPRPINQTRNTKALGRAILDDQSAVETVAKLRGDYVLTRKGVEVTGEMPKTLPEFLTATVQSMDALQTRIGDLSGAADAAGVKVPVDRVISSLRMILGSDGATPQMKAAAKSQIAEFEMLAKKGGFSVADAIERMKFMNKETAEIHMGANVAGSSKEVSGKIAADLRASLNDAMDNPAAPQEFASLRKELGQLMGLEGRLLKMAEREANIGSKHSMSFLDLIAAEQLIRGVARGNIVTGSMEAAASYMTGKTIKKLNSADRAVKRLFRAAGYRTKKAKKEFGDVPEYDAPISQPKPYTETPGGTRIGSTSQVPVPLEPGPFPATPGGTRVGAPTTPRAPLAAQGPYPATPGGTRVGAPTAPLQAPLAQPGPYTITPGRTRR
jgi:hypothetical protein